MIEWAAIVSAAVALLGSIVSVYSSGHSLNQSRHAIANLRQELTDLRHRYEAEAHEMRDSIRLLAVQIIERDKGGDE